MIKERPILFSGPMVQALLRGEKTQTRRVVKGAPEEAGCAVFSQPWSQPGTSSALFFAGPTPESQGLAEVRNPYGLPGDRLWVREAWNALYPITNKDVPWYFHELGAEGAREALAAGVTPTPIYRASEDDPNYPTPDDVEVGFRWQPSIYMPRRFCRLRLELTEVRVERLQSIGEADAQAEGVRKGAQMHRPHGIPNDSYRLGFKHAWDTINGHASWPTNPWVWAVSFKRVDA